MPDVITSAPHHAGPCTIVIFGASGDLTKRLLLPALYNLAAIGMLTEDFSIIGVARREISRDDFCAQMTKALGEFGTQKIDPKLWKRFEERMDYCQGAFDDPATYERLDVLLKQSEKKHGTGGNALFYLAVEPSYFGKIPAQLKAKGMVDERDGKWRRVVIEKPFGRDLASSRELNHDLSAVLKESQIFRIDHYLGKETAQNLLVFRMGNGMFEPIWNRRYIENVQITVAESIGIEGRGAFYETAGAFRDVMQNHMFMLLTLVAMEFPSSLSGETVRTEKAKLLQAMRIITPEAVVRDTVRGQYGPGKVDGKDVPGYRQEPKVDPQSKVETFAAMKLWVDNWRWAGVPFYLRSGKRLPKHSTEIVVHFKCPPLDIFDANERDPVGSNRLIFHIQPEEAISFQVRAKIPGPTIRTRGVKMDFNYNQFGDVSPTTGYEKLLYDCMLGDSTLFHSTAMVEAGWQVAQPILDGWANHPPTDFPNYAPGDWGPPAAQEMLSSGDDTWWVEPKPKS